MACHLLGTKLLPERMINFHQFSMLEQISMKLYLKCQSFHSRKSIWKCCLQNVCHLCSGLIASNDVSSLLVMCQVVPSVDILQLAKMSEVLFPNFLDDRTDGQALEAADNIENRWPFQYAFQRWLIVRSCKDFKDCKRFVKFLITLNLACISTAVCQTGKKMPLHVFQSIWHHNNATWSEVDHYTTSV